MVALAVVWGPFMVKFDVRVSVQRNFYQCTYGFASSLTVGLGQWRRDNEFGFVPPPLR